MNPTLKASEVREIGIDIARPFVERWHYSGCLPTGKNIFLGWYVKSDLLQSDLFGDSLYAVADYGIGVNPYQASFLSAQTGCNIQNGDLLELKRLCRVEPKIKELPLTAFLSKCHKILKSQGFSYIVSFSDPTHNHNGGIYKAANFTHLGTTNPEIHVMDENGNIRHRRYYFRYARRNNVPVEQARQELNLKRVKTLPKDRWFLVLDKHALPSNTACSGLSGTAPESR